MNNAHFDFLAESSLTTTDFNEKIDFVFDGVLAKKLITLFYADGGNGKSWLAFTLANHCASTGMHTLYLDFDNPLSVLKERNVNELLVKRHRNLKYIQRGKCRHTPNELLTQLNEKAVGNVYQDWVIFVDSLRNFCNVNNDQQAMDAMNMLMNLREAGATVIILHHSNKDGKNYQGSNNIRNSIDNMYQVVKLDGQEGEINLHLKVKKERANIINTAFRIDAETLTMTQLDETQVTMSAELEAFVESVTEALTEQSPLNKTQLLKAAGKKKDDKTARAWLDKYDGTYWKSDKAGGVFTYQLIQPSQPKL